MSAKKTILGKIIILSLSLFLIFGYSCIDKKYDLTKDISTVIGMGGELSFPLGETETKLLRDLLKPEDIEDLTTDDDQYGIHKMEHVNANIPTFDPISINPIDAFSNFNISFEKLTIDPIKIEEQQPEILLNKKIIDEPTIDQSFSGSVVSNIEIAPISLSTGGSINLPNIRLNLTEHQTSFIIEAGTCPEEVTQISNIKFSGTTCQLTIDLDQVKNLLNLSEVSVTLKDFIITFPDAIEISNPSKGSLSNTHTLNLNNVKFTETDNTVNFTLTGYNKNIPTSQGKFPEIKETINYSSSGYIDMTGTTNGVSLTGTTTIDIPFGINSSNITVTDMDLAISNIKIEAETTEFGTDVNISDINKDVKKINRVYFDDNSVITLKAEPITLAEGMNLSGDNIKIDLNDPNTPLEFDKTGNTWEGDNLVIPIGELKSGFTKQIKIKSIDLSQKALTTESDGSKSLSFKPQFRINAFTSYVSGNTTYKNITSFNDNSQIHFKLQESTLYIADADIESESFTASLGSNTADIKINQTDVPKELKELKWVKLKNSVPVNLQANIDIIEGAGDLQFDKLVIDFPKYIIFDESSGVTAYTDSKTGKTTNRLILKDQKFTKVSSTERSWKYENKLHIVKLDFTHPDYNNILTQNHKLEFPEEKATVTGQASVSSGNISLNDLQDLSVETSISVGQMNIQMAAGEVSEDIITEYPHTSINLGDLSDYLKEGSALYLPNASFRLSAANPIGVPIDVDLIFTPYKNGSPLVSGGLKPDKIMTIQGYDDLNPSSGETAKTSKFILATPEFIANGIPDGFQAIPFSQLQNVIKDIPDSIVIDAITKPKAVEGENWHTIDLSKGGSQVQIDCNADVPFILGKEVNIVYNDTIKNIQSDTDDIFEKATAKEITISATVYNGLPLELALKIIPLSTGCKGTINSEDLSFTFNDNDEKGYVAAGTYNRETGSTDISETTLTINVREREGSGALRRLDGLELLISGDLGQNEGTVGGVPLKPSQSIKAKVSLKVKDIQADINDF